MGKFVLSYFLYAGIMNAIAGPWRKWSKGRYVDNWTWTHLAWGAVARQSGISLQSLILLSVANEVGEAVIRKHYPQLTFGSPETKENVVIDIAATVAGWKAWST